MGPITILFIVTFFVRNQLQFSSAFVVQNKSNRFHKTFQEHYEEYNSRTISSLGKREIKSFLSASSSIEHDTNNELDNLLSEMHSKEFKFRIIVVGNGAILETTSTLGPNYSSSISPKTNEKMITFPSNDKSFEYHIKPNHVSKVTLSTVKKPAVGEAESKELRIIRFVKDDGSNMCSLILVDTSSDALDWFKSLLSKFGN